MAGGEYKRWRNSKEPGQLMFVTTTVLGYTPGLRKDAEKLHFLKVLVEECRFFGALLHAYCVMDHHVHLVIRAPLHMEMSKFMQGFKGRAAKALLARATPWILRKLAETSKDNRSFWMRSFRGVPIRREEVFASCIRYLHLNPVRAGLCLRAVDCEMVFSATFGGRVLDGRGGRVAMVGAVARRLGNPATARLMAGSAWALWR